MTRALGWVLLLIAGCASAAELAGRVVEVADGDTLTVWVDGRRPVNVRLAGIDAPERDQPFGQRSKQSLAELAFGKTASVAVGKIDDYGRTVGTVTVGGVNLEAEQVRRGLAWVYRHYSDDARLLALEAEAKAARRGVVDRREPDAAVGLAARWEDREPAGGAVGIGPGQVRICGALRGQARLRGHEQLRGSAVLSHRVRVEPAGSGWGWRAV